MKKLNNCSGKKIGTKNNLKKSLILFGLIINKLQFCIVI